MTNLGIIEQMQAEIEALKTRVGVLEYECLATEAPDTAAPTAEVQESVTAQEIRDEIVEKANRDIAGIIRDAESTFCVNRGNEVMRDYTNRVKTIVNKEKRTVVALVYGKHQDVYNELRAKGIAKCTSNDCFNVHIGKAIALRRALGLPVPDEYLNAPQPEEVRVGDIVKWPHADVNYIVTSIEHSGVNMYYTLNSRKYDAYGEDFGGATIIDDSRE